MNIYRDSYKSRLMMEGIECLFPEADKKSTETGKKYSIACKLDIFFVFRQV